MIVLWVVFAGSFAVVLIACLNLTRPHASGCQTFLLILVFEVVGGVSGLWLAMLLDTAGIRWTVGIIAGLMLAKFLVLLGGIATWPNTS
jgi:hypothetical protein